MGITYTPGGLNVSGGGRNMGLGQLASGNVVFKRKYRWTMSLRPHCGNTSIPDYFVKVANRPQITIEETEINFLHGKFWIPGKATWEALTITYYDVSDQGNANNALFTWLATTYNFTDPVGLHQSTLRGQNGVQSGGYGCDGTLQLYDGCGIPLERWTLNGMWPQSINFGELDYSSSEECTIEVTTRYDTAQYEPLCGGSFEICCSGCLPDGANVATL
jgi:hypothetical protein